MPKPKPLAPASRWSPVRRRGIGKAIAGRLAAEGACVVVADLDLPKAPDAAAEIGGADVAVGVAADVSDAEAVAAAFREAALAFGGVDLVVNNAGLSISKPLLETTEQDWDLQHDVMAKGSFLVSREAARIMIEQGMGGDIVYISSKNSLFAGPNNIAYGATKADQAHQVRLLAAELGPHQIRVNGINPDGVVRGSGIFAGGWGASRAAVYGVKEEELGEFYAQRTLLKREVLPDHVADAVFALTGGDLTGRRACTSRSTPASPRRSCDDATAVRQLGWTFAAVDLGASSGRVMAARVGAGPAASCTRRTASPTGRCARRARCTGTCSASTPASSTGCGPPAATPAGSTASASTAGRSTTGCSTPTARCWATRCTTATPGTRPRCRPCTPSSPRRGAVPGQRAAAPAVQHRLPARRPARARPAGRGRTGCC